MLDSTCIDIDIKTWNYASTLLLSIFLEICTIILIFSYTLISPLVSYTLSGIWCLVDTMHIPCLRPKKTPHVSLVRLFLQNWRGRAFFFFFFLLVRFINRGKRSEMVSVVSRHERNEIWIEYIYLPYFLSIKLPYFLGKYKCYTCSIKLKTLILIFGVFQSSTLFMDHQLQLYIQQSQAEHRECRKRIKLKKKKCWRARLELTRALTRDTCVFFWPYYCRPKRIPY